MPATITHAKSNTLADFTGTVTVHNSTLGTETRLATDIVRPVDWNSAHVATLAISPSEMFTLEFFEPVPAWTGTTMAGATLGSWFLDPVYVPYCLTSGVLHLVMGESSTLFQNLVVYSAASTGSISRYQTVNTQLALYRAGTGANSTRLESIWSNEQSMMVTWDRRIGATATSALTVSNLVTFSFPAQFDTAGGSTYSSTAQSGTISVGASTLASTGADSLISGAVSFAVGSKVMLAGFNTSLPPGMYYLAVMMSSSSSSTGTATTYTAGNMFSTQSIMAIGEANIRAFRRVGLSISNSSSVIPNWHAGFLATTSTGPYSTIGTSDIRNLGTPRRHYFYLHRTSY